MRCSALNISISAPNWLLLELISRILLKRAACVWVWMRSSGKWRPAEGKTRCLWGGKGAWGWQQCPDGDTIPWGLLSHSGALWPPWCLLGHGRVAEVLLLMEAPLPWALAAFIWHPRELKTWFNSGRISVSLWGFRSWRLRMAVMTLWWVTVWPCRAKAAGVCRVSKGCSIPRCSLQVCWLLAVTIPVGEIVVVWFFAGLSEEGFSCPTPKFACAVWKRHSRSRRSLAREQEGSCTGNHSC